MRPFVILLVALLGCTPSERQTVAAWAKEGQSELALACTAVETLSSNSPWVDFTCGSLEAADALVARIPTAQKIASSAVVAPDGGTSHVLVTVRCPLVAFKVPVAIVSDAGVPAARD